MKAINLQPFDAHVTVLRTKAERKKFDVDPDVLGCVLTYESGTFVLVVPLKWDEYTVWHEAHHLARLINAYHQVPGTLNSHEADAYMQEHIVREVKTHIYNRKL